MQRVMKLIACALVVIAIVEYRTHRGTAATTHLALQESSSRGGAYVYFPSAHRIHISLKSQGATGVYIDAFEAVASTRISDAVATCLQETLPWTVNAACTKPGWISVIVSGALRARAVTAVFPDGSTRTYAFDDVANSYLPIPGSTRDRFGNGIPESVAMASNGGGLATYAFQGSDSNRDRAQLVQQLSRLGVGGDYADHDMRQPITCVARPDGTVCLHAL